VPAANRWGSRGLARCHPLQHWRPCVHLARDEMPEGGASPPGVALMVPGQTAGWLGRFPRGWFLWAALRARQQRRTNSVPTDGTLTACTLKVLAYLLEMVFVNRQAGTCAFARVVGEIPEAHLSSWVGRPSPGRNRTANELPSRLYIED
jgi:hypothetical protein